VPYNLSGGLGPRRFLIAVALAATALSAALPAQAASALTIHGIISKYTLAAGFHATDVTAMKKIADYESHDHPTSHSKSCWGLFQLSTSMVKGHPWSDPVWNTKRAHVREGALRQPRQGVGPHPEVRLVLGAAAPPDRYRTRPPHSGWPLHFTLVQTWAFGL